MRDVASFVTKIRQMPPCHKALTPIDRCWAWTSETGEAQAQPRNGIIFAYSSTWSDLDR